MTCALCGFELPLQNSHIIPKFVTRYLNGSSGTGYIRHSTNPNVKTQDGPKIKLLCDSCEKEISKHESWFKSKVFDEILKEEPFEIDYDDSFIRFLASLSWRTIQYYERTGQGSPLNEDEKTELSRAEKTLREFLTRKIPNPGKYEQHFFPMGALPNMRDPEAPNNFNRYLLRSMGCDIIRSPNEILIITKLPSMLVIGFVKPFKPNIWNSSKARMQGKLKPQSNFLPAGMRPYLFEKSRYVQRLHDGLSERQKSKIRDAVKENPDMVANSETFRAFAADLSSFGPEVFEKESEEDRVE
jgi:hypothetical protein